MSNPKKKEPNLISEPTRLRYQTKRKK